MMAGGALAPLTAVSRDTTRTKYVHERREGEDMSSKMTLVMQSESHRNAHAWTDVAKAEEIWLVERLPHASPAKKDP